MRTRIARHAAVAWTLSLLLPACFAAAPPRAAVAPTPISEPTVITESGSYVVTKDFTAATGNAIRLMGGITVDIDFAGHTVRASGGSAIMLHSYPEVSPCPSVTLHDGRIVGGGNYGGGIWSVTARVWPGSDVVIQKMTLENAPVWIEDGRLTVKSSHLINSEMFSDANFRQVFAWYEDNDVISGDLIAWGSSGGLISRNVVQGGSIEVDGSDGRGSYNDRVEENKVYGSIIVGLRHAGETISGLVLRRNFVTGSIFIRNGRPVWVAENYVGGCGLLGAGINVSDSRDGLLEKNELVGACPFGIGLDLTTRGNVYRNNVVENATSASVFDQGVGNIDGGGNTAIIGADDDSASLK